MDNLEEYIMKHREDMDRRSPSSGIWRGIRRNLKPAANPLRKWIAVAATVAILTGSGLALFRPLSRLVAERSAENTGKMTPRENLQLKETEIYYNNLANLLYREAKPMLAKNPEIKKELSMDMCQLDSICADIKKDLKDNVANKDVIEALIQNYRIKIRLLEDVLNNLKENEDHEKKTNREL
jgi:hypothetical protein